MGSRAKKTVVDEQRQREDVQALPSSEGEERVAFAEQVAQIDPFRIKVVDESRVVLGQRLPYGYSTRGERCVDHGRLRSSVVRSVTDR